MFDTFFLLGQKWRTHRKLIAPTFHLNVLKNFIELFNSNSKECVNRLRSLNGSTFDCHKAMLEVTVEILLGKYATYRRKFLCQ